ncbi:copper chaperone PCu(A)C [Streptomyces sp. RKND-216]|uniref:copper chaperone PCu(A)C n=1 Tax=Streptomyces sp. RKND-216 TaxID=2562581 RepID=UPI00109D9430|nr:copper chaperone PCu(A)C [Streptomyces sp. RKND-216]THA25537.1 copper chaperone PCu(A)C [Streptomyces sp. RKND-216]
MNATRARDPRRHHGRTATAASLALTGALALGACSTGTSAQAGHGGDTGHEQGLQVTGAYMPAPLMTDMAGGYFVVRNHGPKDDRLTEVTSGLAESVDMHRTVDGQMQRVDSLPVPADGKLELRRGGNHLMFHDLDRKPAEGDTVRMKLHFAHHDPVTVEVPVKATHHDPSAGDPRESGDSSDSGSHEGDGGHEDHH